MMLININKIKENKIFKKNIYLLGKFIRNVKRLMRIEFQIRRPEKCIDMRTRSSCAKKNTFKPAKVYKFATFRVCLLSNAGK